MSTERIGPPNQENEHHSGNKGRQRAFVWEFFEKITGDDGLPKTRCTNCNKVYCFAANSGTSTMRRHLRKCCPQPLTQVSPTQLIPRKKTKTPRFSEELSDEARAAKKLKSVMVEDLQTKTDRELVEFIWMNKRNVGLLEQKLPHKAIAIKEAIKCYEGEIDRRANLLLPKENGGCPITCIESVKVEADDPLDPRYKNVSEIMAEDVSAVAGKIVETHRGVTQHDDVLTLDNGNLVVKVEVGDQSGSNGNFDGYIAEDERAERLQIVAINGNENQTPAKQSSAISILPQDICSELKEVSSVLSMLTSLDNFYTPEGSPLDEEAENAKQTLTDLLKKDFETIIGSPDEQNVKVCIQILIKNLHKLPRFQGKVIETLNMDFEIACKNWTTWCKNIENNIAFEVQHGENLQVLQAWQEKDMEFESKIEDIDADILQLKAELREKELIRESLVKQKSDLFDQSKISIDEAKRLLQEMVTVKLQSDVAIDNMKEFSSKWVRIRENFKSK
uniref:uncharacterized protein LOC122585401 isoform X1 n=1 Tax=Erigeron canadensis TaxID=72917 RepID=UPI001CB8B681|nr:uncharacterized protein LOC122585401 isoform X1 [Erigeron canadensis]XP_043613470.1 uncharacterized protein LOC122585401 isoform X1 [Erigeron canadensis]